MPLLKKQATARLLLEYSSCDSIIVNVLAVLSGILYVEYIAICESQLGECGIDHPRRMLKKKFHFLLKRIMIWMWRHSGAGGGSAANFPRDFRVDL